MLREWLLIILLSVSLFSNTLEEIKNQNHIKIGVRLSQPPFSVLNEDGKFEGFEVELAKKIGEKILGKNAKIELVGVNAKDRVKFLNDNVADLMIANFTQNKEREKLVLFSMPYLSSNLSTVSKKGSDIKKEIDLINRKPRILAVPNTTSFEYFDSKGIGNFSIVSCQNSSDCYKKLINNEGDVYLHTNILIAYLPIIDQNLEIGIKAIGNANYIAVAAKLGNEKLIEAVNNAIIELSTENFFKDAYNKTLEPFYRGTIDKKYLLLDDIYRLFAE